MKLKNETILITGATSGFGKACAELFIREGAKIIICGRRKERLSALQKKLGKQCYYFVLDVRNKKSVFNAIKSLPKDFKNITTLINNAGLALGLEPAYKCSLDDWETMIDTNIKGVTFCTMAVLPGMVKRNRGFIVNIGSIAGTYPYPGGNVYGSTKAFLRQFTLNLKADLLGTKVRVTNIEPGMAETEFSVVRYKGNKKRADSVYTGTKPLTERDIAETVLWCITRPAHVNINTIELMSVDQAFSPFAVNRN